MPLVIHYLYGPLDGGSCELEDEPNGALFIDMDGGRWAWYERTERQVYDLQLDGTCPATAWYKFMRMVLDHEIVHLPNNECMLK